MYKFGLTIVVFFIFTQSIVAKQPENIIICTPAWEGYTQKDGKGIYHDVWREIYEKKGVKIIVKYTPFKRCENTLKFRKTNNSKYDTVASAYASDLKHLITPKWHLDADLISVVSKKGVSWEGQSTLTNKRVGWIVLGIG